MSGSRLSQIPIGVPTGLGNGLTPLPHLPSQECVGGHSLTPSLVVSTPLPPPQGPRKVCEKHPQLEGLVQKFPEPLATAMVGWGGGTIEATGSSGQNQGNRCEGPAVCGPVKGRLCNGRGQAGGLAIKLGIRVRCPCHVPRDSSSALCVGPSHFWALASTQLRSLILDHF